MQLAHPKMAQPKVGDYLLYIYREREKEREREREKVHLGESDKRIKISGKEDKSNAYNRFNGNNSFFINRKTLSD